MKIRPTLAAVTGAVAAAGAISAAMLAVADAPAGADSPTGEKTIRMTVAPEQVDCTGVAPMRCLNVKTGAAGHWSPLYGSIDGFTYERGYTWQLDVREVPVSGPEADRSSVEYHLVKVISKTPA